jgi:hypothetical protein
VLTSGANVFAGHGRMLEGMAGTGWETRGRLDFVYERQGKGNGKVRGRSEARTGAVLDHITEPNSPGWRPFGVIGAGPGVPSTGGNVSGPKTD